MQIADLAPVIAASWPPVSTRMTGAFTVPDGAGGGQRVSAARLTDSAATDTSEAEIDMALAALEGIGQPPLFMVLGHQTGLERPALPRRGSPCV